MKQVKFADKIMLLRSKKNVSQKELAKALNVSRQSVYKWEADLSVPATDKIKKIASFFNVSYEELLNDSVSIYINEDEKNVVSSQAIQTRKFNAKLFIGIIIPIIVAIIIVLLIAQSPKNNENDDPSNTDMSMHKLKCIETIKEATCEEKGLIKVKCDECDYIDTIYTDAKGHEFLNNECVVCNYIEGTTGIQYAIIEEKNMAYVKSLGDSWNAEIIISNKYKDYDVKEIGAEAFSEKDIKSIKIPDSVEIIREKAFYKCRNLNYVDIGLGVKTIERQAFYDCGDIKFTIYSKALENIGDEAFYNTNINYLLFSKNLKCIGQKAFYKSKIEKVEFCKSATWNITHLDKVIKTIEITAYSNCEELIEMLNSKYHYYVWKINS